MNNDYEIRSQVSDVDSLSLGSDITSNNYVVVVAQNGQTIYSQITAIMQDDPEWLDTYLSPVMRSTIQARYNLITSAVTTINSATPSD